MVGCPKIERSYPRATVMARIQGVQYSLNWTFTLTTPEERSAAGNNSRKLCEDCYRSSSNDFQALVLERKAIASRCLDLKSVLSETIRMLRCHVLLIAGTDMSGACRNYCICF